MSHDKVNLSPSLKATLDSTIQEDEEDDSIFCIFYYFIIMNSKS